MIKRIGHIFSSYVENFKRCIIIGHKFCCLGINCYVYWPFSRFKIPFASSIYFLGNWGINFLIVVKRVCHDGTEAMFRVGFDFIHFSADNRVTFCEKLCRLRILIQPKAHSLFSYNSKVSKTFEIGLIFRGVGIVLSVKPG